MYRNYLLFESGNEILSVGFFILHFILYLQHAFLHISNYKKITYYGVESCPNVPREGNL